MNEIAVVFGPERHLTGTLSMPAKEESAKFAVLLLNAGVIHRIGPHRFNVKLARELTRNGIPCLRFDLSGQGDSRVPAQAQSFERQAVADLQAAMDHMERLCNVRQFVIAGICSGAQNGLATAQVDQRVIGLWMQDGYMYPTRKTRWVRYRLQLSSRFLSTLRSWTVSLLRKLGSAFGRNRRGTRDEPDRVDYGHRAPSREEYARIMDTLTQRGVQMYLTYTGSMLWWFNYPEQLSEAFKGHVFVDAVRCEFLPHIDHTATLLSSQRHLITSIRDWALSLKGGAT